MMMVQDVTSCLSNSRSISAVFQQQLFTVHRSVSHPTDDLVFQWDKEIALDVWPSIELPQLQLIRNYTADCTQPYATGNRFHSAFTMNKYFFPSSTTHHIMIIR